MAEAKIINGKAFAETLRGRIAQDVAVLRAKGVQPGLAVVLVGEEPHPTLLRQCLIILLVHDSL